MGINVCDIKSTSFDENLLSSVINSGFAVITNHNIDFGLIKQCQNSWKEFFTKNQTYKNLYINGNNTNMGYKGLQTEIALNAKNADLKEFFHWHPGEDLPDEVKSDTIKLFYRLETVGFQILSVLQKHTNSKYVWDCYNSPNTIFRSIYYPALKNFSDIKKAIRAAPHEDINYITLLVASSSSGLEVQDNCGEWHKIPHEENSIICNIGDMLKIASDGVFKSTTHRVVNSEDFDSDRISLPLFIHPNPQTVLMPGLTAQQFLKERLSQIYK